MASRFGGASQAQVYATKVRWLVGGLVSIIIVLSAAFLIVVQSSTPTDISIGGAQPALAMGTAAAHAEVLVAVNRIEKGMPLRPELFTTVLIAESELPMGALRKQDLSQLNEKYAAQLINPGAPLTTSSITDRRASTIDIPQGYRAVTILVDRRSSVEYFARPDSRVDVLWTFVKDGKQQLATIVRFVKILSVAGTTAQNLQAGNVASVEGQGQTTVTLLALERDAKKIELARSIGVVSLTLVGEEDEVVERDDPGIITPGAITGTLEPRQATPDEPKVAGTLYTTDPRTGKQTAFILPEGGRRWVRHPEW